MNRKLVGLLLAGSMLASLAVPAGAESFNGSEDWKVYYSKDKKVISNFTTGEMDEVISQLQPGDDVTLHVTVANESSVNTAWYMSNEVVKTLEQSVANAAGGGYEYYLSYVNSDGETVDVYSSDTVGGDNNQSDDEEGMLSATDNMEELFLMDDSVQPGEKCVVTLVVSLDGETQGNDYQDSLAELNLTFGVEESDVDSDNPDDPDEPDDDDDTPTPHKVKTGDENNMLPLYIAAAVSGTILLILAFFSLRRKKNDDK